MRTRFERHGRGERRAAFDFSGGELALVAEPRPFHERSRLASSCLPELAADASGATSGGRRRRGNAAIGEMESGGSWKPGDTLLLLLEALPLLLPPIVVDRLLEQRVKRRIRGALPLPRRRLLRLGALAPLPQLLRALAAAAEEESEE